MAGARNRLGVDPTAIESPGVAPEHNHHTDGAWSWSREWSYRNRRHGHGYKRCSRFTRAGSNSADGGKERAKYRYRRARQIFLPVIASGPIQSASRGKWI